MGRSLFIPWISERRACGTDHVEGGWVRRMKYHVILMGDLCEIVSRDKGIDRSIDR